MDLDRGGAPVHHGEPGDPVAGAGAMDEAFLEYWRARGINFLDTEMTELDLSLLSLWKNLFSATRVEEASDIHLSQSETGKVSDSGRPSTALSSFISGADPFSMEDLTVRQPRLENVEKGRLIAEGTFGSVYRGLWNESVVAIKILHRDVETQRDLEEFANEVKILASLNHPNLVQYYGFSQEGPELMMVMEYMPGGSLLKLLQESGVKFENDELYRMVRQVAEGMKFLGANRIVHRDLACRNCLTSSHDSDCTIKVADFGLARFVRSDLDFYDAGEVKGIPVRWSAPETLKFARSSTKSDVWSFGVFLFELFSGGHVPFSNLSDAKVVEGVKDGSLRLDKPRECDEQFWQDVVEPCFASEPADRIDFYEILSRLRRFQRTSIEVCSTAEDDKQEIALAGAAGLLTISLQDLSQNMPLPGKSWVAENQLTSLPPEIGQLRHLQKLDCHSNQLTSLPPEIGQLSQLEGLWCHDNQLTSLPAEIGQLSQLEGLWCHDNQLTSLPAEIGQLRQLRVLKCGDNRLTSLPPEIGQLSQLQKLDCGSNQLTSLPPEIGQLSQLEILNCSHNLLETLPIELKNLQNLGDHSYNTEGYVTDDSSFSHNPLLSPPVFVANDSAKAVVAYLADLDASGGAVLEQPRVTMVGHGGVGKSTTAEALTRAPGTNCSNLADAHYESTRGMALLNWSLPGVPPLRVRLWDLAGQLEYYATHALLMNGALVLYLLIVSLTGVTRPQGDGHGAEGDVEVSLHEQLALWLRFMRLLSGAEFSGEHRRSMLVVVGTHVDQLESVSITADAAEIGLRRLDRGLRALPEDLRTERILFDADLSQGHEHAPDLQVLDLRSGDSKGTQRIDALRERVSTLVRSSTERAALHPVPKTYVELFGLLDALRKACEVDFGKKSAEGPHVGSEEQSFVAEESFSDPISRWLLAAKVPPASISKITAALLAEEFDTVDSLSDLDEEALKEMGVSIRNRKMILRALKEGISEPGVGFPPIAGPPVEDLIDYARVPCVNLDELMARTGSIFDKTSDGLLYLGRALRFLQSSGSILLSGPVDEALRSSQTARYQDCHVFLDMQWVSALSGQFIGPFFTSSLSGDRAMLSTLDVEARLEGLVTLVSASDVQLIMEAMSRLELCFYDSVRKKYLFPSLLSEPSAEAQRATLPPGHNDGEEGGDVADGAIASVARVLTFGADPKLDMVPPGLFSRLQVRLLERAGAQRASKAALHRHMIRLTIGITTVWALELPSRLSVAVALSGSDGVSVMAQLAFVLDDLRELSRPFAGATVRENACCFHCLRGEFFDNVEGPLLFPCPELAASDRESLWSRVLTGDIEHCLGTSSATGTVFSKSIWHLLTGSELPTDPKLLCPFQEAILRHFQYYLPRKVRDDLEEDLQRSDPAITPLEGAFSFLEQSKENFCASLDEFLAYPRNPKYFEKSRQDALTVAGALAGVNTRVLQRLEAMHGGDLRALTARAMNRQGYAMSNEQWASLGPTMETLRQKFYLLVKCYRSEYLATLSQPRRVYDCFVAHAGEEKELAMAMRQRLSDSGAVTDVADVFLDQPSLENFGDAAHDMFDAACRCRAGVFLASRSAVEKQWCMMELLVFSARALLEEGHGNSRFLLAPMAFAPEGQDEFPHGQKPWINVLNSLALPWGHHGADAAAPTMPNVIGSVSERRALLEAECDEGSVIHQFLLAGRARRSDHAEKFRRRPLPFGRLLDGTVLDALGYISKSVRGVQERP